MHILFDSQSSQVECQNETQQRLDTLFGAITGKGWTYAQTVNPITTQQLAGADVLVILTRLRVTTPGTTNPFAPDFPFAFSDAEIQAITNFVWGGGGLVHMSNHGPFPGNPDDDQQVNDRVLAKAFGVYLDPAAFQLPGGGIMTMSGSLLSSNPAITSTILNGVKSIAAHNTCSIAGPASATVIASIPKEAVNVSPSCTLPAAGNPYAITLTYGSGKVIITGNSGITGDADSDFPAPGLIDTADNKRFILNCLSYVGE